MKDAMAAFSVAFGTGLGGLIDVVLDPSFLWSVWV